MRYAAGKKTQLPPWAVDHLIAVRYGTTPEAVRDWPADDFLHAIALEPFMERGRG